MTVAIIASQVEVPRIHGDAGLSDRRDASLLHPSLLRLAKVATVDGDLAEKVTGKLCKVDHATARKAFQRVFPPWIR